MPKVTLCSLGAEEGPHFDILKAAGFEVEVANREWNLFNEDDMIAAIRGSDAVMAGSEPYTCKVIEASPQLRVIARTGVGFDAVDLTTCNAQDIVVTTTPGVNHHAVAEHTLALLMGVARGFPELDQRVRSNRWVRNPRPRIRGRVLGIVGLGRIGRAVATRAVGLGMQVIAYEPFPNPEFVDLWNIELVEFDDLLARSDFVSLHLPATPENVHLMNSKTFAKMKKGSILINTARGALVDEAALYDVLKSGHLRGAGLDVFEVEPLPTDSPLISLDNVLLSGHVAGMDQEAQYDTFKMCAETIVQLFDGEWPAECIQNLRNRSGWTWARE